MHRALRNEKGFTLVEVIIGLAILGLIAIAILAGLAIGSRAIITADEKATAESLARSQMEYIKNQPYQEAPPYVAGDIDTGQVTYEIIDTDDYTMCSIYVNSVNELDTICNAVYGIPWDSQEDHHVYIDVGIQKITLILKHGNKIVFTLEDYKVDR